MSVQRTRIKPFKPEQREFCKQSKRYMGYVSGVGAGKTFGGIIRTIRNMTEWNPGEMGAIVAPSRQMIINVIIPQMRDMGLFDPPINWEHNSAHSDEPGIHAPNGSRALILSADNRRTIERLRGLNLAWGWIDEEAVVDPRAREILQQRLRTGNHRNLSITTTPKGKNHTYDFFVREPDAEKEPIGEGVKYEAEDRLAIVGVPTGRNPHTPDDYKEAMLSDMPDGIVAQEVMGEFVEIGSGVLNKSMLTAADSEVLESSELTFQVGVDVGIESDSRKAQQNDTDYWAAGIVAHHRRHGEAFVVDVARKRGLSMQQGLNWIEGVLDGVPSPTVNIESVHAQKFLLQEAQDRGLPVTGVDQSLTKEDRLIQLSVPFESDRIRLINFTKSPEQGLDDRWDDFVQEWIAFPDGTHDDMLDAVELALRNIDIGGAYSAEPLDIYGRDT